MSQQEIKTDPLEAFKSPLEPTEQIKKVEDTLNVNQVEKSPEKVLSTEVQVVEDTKEPQQVDLNTLFGGQGQEERKSNLFYKAKYTEGENLNLFDNKPVEDKLSKEKNEQIPPVDLFKKQSAEKVGTEVIFTSEIPVKKSEKKPMNDVNLFKNQSGTDIFKELQKETEPVENKENKKSLPKEEEVKKSLPKEEEVKKIGKVEILWNEQCKKEEVKKVEPKEQVEKPQPKQPEIEDKENQAQNANKPQKMEEDEGKITVIEKVKRDSIKKVVSKKPASKSGSKKTSGNKRKSGSKRKYQTSKKSSNKKLNTGKQRVVKSAKKVSLKK